MHPHGFLSYSKNEATNSSTTTSTHIDVPWKAASFLCAQIPCKTTNHIASQALLNCSFQTQCSKSSTCPNTSLGRSIMIPNQKQMTSKPDLQKSGQRTRE